MTDVGLESSVPLRVASASVFVATIAVITALIAALLSLDLFLARIDRRESAARAAAEYREGLIALRAGRPSEAVDHLGTAVGIDRSSVDYSLALGDAMLRDGRTTEAESTVRGLLDRAENDGAVNLVMAHVMIREGRYEDAKAFLHRAIFGRWGADSTDRRTAARFELIDLLTKRGAPSQLLAELLPLEDVSPDSVALRRRLGELFIVAGSPIRAANMFRDVLRNDPNDAESFAGMGQAALALGNLRTARADFAAAARLRPDDAHTAARLALVDTVLALDPTAAGLVPFARVARGRALLSRTVSVVGSCPGTPSAPIDSARALLAPPPAHAPTARRMNYDGAADALTQAAAQLWGMRPPACDAATSDEVLRLTIGSVTR